jgi:hypothetical protein
VSGYVLPGTIGKADSEPRVLLAVTVELPGPAWIRRARPVAADSGGGSKIDRAFHAKGEPARARRELA